MIRSEQDGPDPIKVLIVEDNDLVVEALVRCCDVPGLAVVGTAWSGDSASAMVEDHGPDIALIDYRLGAEDGITVARTVLEQAPGMKVLIITGDLTPAIEARAKEAGCWGCLEKTVRTGRAIPDLLRRAHAGLTI